MNRLARILLPLLYSALFLVGLALFTTSRTLLAEMGRVSFEQILMHADTPVQELLHGMPASMRRWLWMDAALALLFLLYATGTLSALVRLLSRRRLSVNLRQRWLAPALAIAVLLGALCAAACDFRFFYWLANQRLPSTMIDEHFHAVKQDAIVPPERPRNLVLIIAESLENTFADSSLFADSLLPELAALQQEGTAFTGCAQLNGTDCTIAATTAILYGMPRLYRDLGRRQNDVEGNYFHHLPSLPAILLRSGYNYTHIQGSNAIFAGTRFLFETIPGCEMLDSHHFLDDPEYVQYCQQKCAMEWGANDAIVFRHAREKCTALAADGRPFALSVATMDTHIPVWLPPNHPRPYGDDRDAFREQSRLIAEFVEWIRQQPWGDSTAIVITGDHCAMRTTLGPVDLADLSDGCHRHPADGELPRRSVYNCFLNTAFPPQGCVPRLHAVFDLCPTILEALGFTVPGHRLALGTSLYSSLPTLLEQVGVTAYERESRRRSKTLKALLNAKTPSER